MGIFFKPLAKTWKELSKEEKRGVATNILKSKRFFILPAIIFSPLLFFSIKPFLYVYSIWLTLSFSWKYIDKMTILRPQNFEALDKFLDKCLFVTEYIEKEQEKRRARGYSETDTSDDFSFDPTWKSLSCNIYHR